MTGEKILEKENSKQGGRRTSKAFPLIMLLIMALVCAVCMGYMGYIHYDKQLENEAEMLRISAQQAASGLDMQLAKLEDASVTLMADSEYTDFDAADFSTMSEYDMTRRLSELKNKVTGLSLIDNYCDFTLLYRNDAAAGKLSEGSRELLGDDDGKIYPVLTDMLGEKRRIWVTGIDGNFNKVFYICRANEHTLFVGGFYTDELRYMLTDAELKDKVSMLLEDGDGNVIMSVSNSEGTLEPEEGEGGSYAVITDTAVQVCRTLDNGWKIVLIKDMTAIYEFYKKLALEVAVLMVLTMAVLTVMYVVRTKDEQSLGGSPMLTPEVDMLTGITNAEEAENTIADRLETCAAGSTYMLALVKIVNMEELGKRYGRAGYNGSIIKTYRGLAEFFGTDDPTSENIVGRIGEGKFIVMANFTQYDLFKANDALKDSLVKLSEHMNSVMLANQGDMQICIGAAVFPHSSGDYDELYDMAEKALEDAVNDDERSYAVYSKKSVFRK